MKNYLKLFKKSQFSAGFTLAEVMLAASLSLVVVGAAGLGLVNLLRNSQTANASSEIQYDLNRAVEFISDEIKAANKVGTDASIAADFNSDSGKKKAVFILEMPQVDADGNPLKVVYYTRAKTDEPNSQWQGPQILYRWGPNFDSNGQYKTNAAGKIPTPKDGTKLNWQYEALVDLVADNIDSNKKTCKNTGLNWRRYPVDDVDVKGFFICLRSDGKLVELHANALATPNDQDKTAYEVTTEVFARAEAARGGGDNPFPRFKIEPDGRITLIDKSRVTLQEVSTTLICNQPKKVTPKLRVNDPPNKKNDPTLVSSGVTLNEKQQVFIEVLETGRTDCGKKYIGLPLQSETEGGKWIKALKKGDSLANIPGNLKELEYLLEKSSIKFNPDTHTVDLGLNEVLLFVEIEKTTQSVLDYNEKIVKITFDNP